MAVSQLIAASKKGRKRIMVLGKGSTTATLTTEDIQQLLASADEQLLVGTGLDPTNKRVLVIIPDGTRTAPIPLMFRLLYEQFGRRAAQLDYLIALGTHPPMLQEAIDHLVGVTAVQRVNEPGYYIKTPYIDHLVGVTAAERAERYPNVRIFNHDWHNPQALQTIGVIMGSEAAEMTGGLLTDDVPVTLNRLIFAYDLLLICGPVFPHEVAGFSGGAKYLFPGIAGPDIINFTHWLGALVTSMHTIGIKDTPVLRVITQAAAFVPRISVTLATGIPEERCRHINLGYADYREIDPEACMGREQEGILYVPHAGEVLYRARGI